MMQRRNITRGLAAAVAGISAVALLASCAGSGANSGDSESGLSTEPVVVGSWGGSFDEALQTAYFDDFTADTGIEVIIAPADYARWIAMNEGGSSEWNSVDAGGARVFDWDEAGFLSPLPSGAERSDLLTPGVAEFGAGGYLNSFVLVYNKDVYDNAPSSWADLWDTQQFPGTRAIVGIYEGFVEIAALADGATSENLYPIDLDRAFEKLDELKPHLLITQGYAELRQAIDTGQVDMAVMPSGSAARSVIASEGSLEIMWNDNIMTEGVFPISNFGPNQEGFSKLVEYMQDPERQAVFTNLSYYGAAMSQAEQFIDPEILPYMSSYSPNYAEGIFPDYAWYKENNEDIVDRFSTWMSQ